MQTPRPRSASSADYDVLLCCPDPGREAPCGTLASYLTRAGFRVFYEPTGAVLASPRRLAIARSASDFVLFLPAAAPASPVVNPAWHEEAAAALESGRNIIRVSIAGESADAVPPTGLEGLTSQQAAVYDPDRLAESLSVIQHCLSTDSIVSDRHVMRRWQRWFLFAGLLVLAGFLAQTVPILYREWTKPKPPPPVAPFVLHWTAFAEREVAGVAEEFALTPGVAVRAGDRVQLAFSPSADGFAYVVAKDSRGRVSVLFPTANLKGASRVRAGLTYHAPIETGWLSVDAQEGLDTLYVFAGYDPLQNLEELIEETETGTDTTARRGLVEQTVNGLLDGRHYPVGPRLWTRTTAMIDQSLEPRPAAGSFSVTGRNGRSITHPAARQPGLVNALAEIKVTFERQP